MIYPCQPSPVIWEKLSGSSVFTLNFPHICYTSHKQRWCKKLDQVNRAVTWFVLVLTWRRCEAGEVVLHKISRPLNWLAWKIVNRRYAPLPTLPAWHKNIRAHHDKQSFRWYYTSLITKLLRVFEWTNHSIIIHNMPNSTEPYAMPIQVYLVKAMHYFGGGHFWCMHCVSFICLDEIVLIDETD